MKRLCYIYPFIIIFHFNACSTHELSQKAKQAQQIVSDLQRNPINPYTQIVYPTQEESEQATRDHLKKQLSKIQSDQRPLDVRALVVIPTLKAIEDTVLSNFPGSKRNIAWHIAENYVFISQVIQKCNIFKTTDVKKSDQPKDINMGGYDIVLYPSWDTSAMPWEMEKWYLKKVSDDRVTEIDKYGSKESWLYDIKKAAQGKPQSRSTKQPIQPVAQSNAAATDKAYIQSLEKRVLTGWMRDSFQACKAIEELGKIGDPDSVPTLLKALHLSPPMRVYAARALGEMGPKAKTAAPTLRSLLNDQSYFATVDPEFGGSIREEISKALPKIDVDVGQSRKDPR